MAVIALTTANRVEVIDSVEQKTLVAGVAIVAGNAVYPDVNGVWAKALATAASNCANVHIATRTAAAGEGLTAIKRGKMDGFALSGLAYGDSVFLSDTAGSIQTTAGTVSVLLGRCQPSAAQPLGTAPDKTFAVNCPV